MSMQEIWHCPSEPDRALADILVRVTGFEAWWQLAIRFNQPYPNTLAGKYDLAYRLLGCKTEVSTN